MAMSGDSESITHLHLSTIERWMEQNHQSQMETNKSISKLAENVNELVTQEKLRTQRDVVTAQEIDAIKETQSKYKASWDWTKKMYDAWNKYLDKYIRPAIISLILITLAGTAGVSIYNFAAPMIKAEQTKGE